MSGGGTTQVALARLLRAPGRAVACVTALALAVGFAVLVQLAGVGLQQVVRAADTASLGAADAAVRIDWSAPGAGALAADVARLPEVAAATRAGTALAEVSLPGTAGTRSGRVVPTPPEGALRWGTLVEGAWPTAPGEVAVTAGTPGAEVGGVVRVLEVLDATGTLDQAVAPSAEEPLRLQVVGVVDVGNASDVPSAGLFLDPGQAVALGAGAQELLVQAAAGVTDEALLTALAPVADPVGGEVLDITTVREERESTSATMLTFLRTAVGAFAALAVAVAVVVVANTWSVLLAQRVREQALLRCVGASRRDLWRSGLTEAAFLGVAGGVAGLLVGWGGALLARVAAVRLLDAAVPVPVPSVATVAAALALGVVASLVAALRPLRRARGVSPLAALRPVEVVPETATVSRTRRVVGGAMVVLGGLGTAVGASTGSGTQRLLVAMPSALLAFCGVLVLAGLVLPRVAGWLADGLRRVGGVPAELAAASARRNPRRTAATGAAVLIGVTLAVTAAVGASSLRETSAQWIAAELPVDTTVTVPGLDAAGRQALRDDLAAVDGVGEVVVASQGPVLLERPDAGDAGTGVVSGYGTLAYSGDVARVVPDADVRPAEGSVVVSAPVAEAMALATGDVVRLSPDGSPGSAQPRSAVVVVDADTRLPVLLAPGDAAGVGTAPVLLVALSPGLSDAAVTATVDAVSELAVTADQSAALDSPVLQLGSLQRTFDVLLGVVAGLLAVTVVIAMVGVSTTVSLSLVERRQENALLRALGLSSARLRRMVAAEAAVLGAVGAVVGTVLGVGFGVAGTHALVAGSEEVVVALPWLWLVAVPLGVGAVAVAASLWPAYRASRTAPSAALAVTL